jgi:nucleoid-associated protein YgaU
MPISGNIVKAELRMLEPKSTGPGGPIGAPITFQFNPKEYTVKKAAKWESKPAKGATKAPMPEFKGADPQTLTIECFFDATDKQGHDITKDIARLLDCCTPHATTLPKNRPSPPFVVFAWGSSFSVTACVKSVSVKYTLFKSDGTPTRATATIEMQEVPSDPAKQNPTSGGLAVRSSHTVVAGDSLPSVAFAEYGNPNLWRAIAITNGIDNPMRVAAGTRLLLPTPEEALALS